MMFANKIGSSTGCSIWLPETSPPSSYRGFLPPPFSKLQHFPSVRLRNPHLASASRSMMVSASRSERESRSSFHTTSTSPFATGKIDAIGLNTIRRWDAFLRKMVVEDKCVAIFHFTGPPLPP